jgi:threonylcarbamoyladenosine tRNA methylthiotransferase MtaB
MGRRYTAERFRERIERVRQVMPDAFIGIDVIVGFPGEEEVHFQETYTLLEELAPSFLHIFPFSERPGTPAVEMSGKVPPQVATERAERLEALSRKLHRAFVEREVGREAEVLFESTMRGGLMFGYTGNYCRFRAPYNRALINRIVRVKSLLVEENDDLSGEILEK